MFPRWHRDRSSLLQYPIAPNAAFGHKMSSIAILTGASSGIGATAARRFVDNGDTVINISRRTCPVAGVESLPTDFADKSSVASTCGQLIERLASHEGSPICLVHNAALMLKDRCDTTEDDDLGHVLAVNVVGINALNRALLPGMPAQSSVLYVGSTLSEKAVAGAFSYIVSKHAQLGMMRATCQDLMGRGIHTALICPGFTDTTMLRQHVGHDESVLDHLGTMNSFGRLVTPDEIADMIFWAHHNPVINGSVMHGNLGQVEH